MSTSLRNSLCTISIFIALFFQISLCEKAEFNEQTPLNSEDPLIDIPEPIKDRHGIWQLSDNQFDPFLDMHSSVAILFTQPDDLYSYAGKYHFDRAANILTNLRNSTTQFAVLEGDQHESVIHSEFEIDSYPTIKYCHHDYLSPAINGENENESDREWEIRCLDYNHHVIELMVVRWIEGLSSECSFSINNIDEFDAAKKENEVLIVGFFDDLTSIEFQLYEDLCKQYKWERDIWSFAPSFAIVTNQDFANTLSERIPNLIAYCAFKEHAWIYDGSLRDRTAIRNFIETERYPFFVQITAFNFKQYTEELDLPLIWVAIDDEYEEYVEKVDKFWEQIGIDYKGYLSIVWISSNAYMGHIRKLGFPFVPGVMFVDDKNNYKQLYDPKANILDFDKIKAFVDSCLDGSGTLFIKSQDVEDVQTAVEQDRQLMEKQDILVRHVNGNELQEILEGNEEEYGKYNVVVFYYAPWDERCTEFHSVYEHIAEMLMDENGMPIYDDLLLLKIDATANDTPISINVYPKIYLYKNGVWPKTADDKNTIPYRRRRRETVFIEWVTKMCGYQVAEEEVVNVEVSVDGQQHETEDGEDEDFEYE